MKILRSGFMILKIKNWSKRSRDRKSKIGTGDRSKE